MTNLTKAQPLVTTCTQCGKFKQIELSAFGRNIEEPEMCKCEVGTVFRYAK